MAKKDFSKVNTNPVYDIIDEATSSIEETPEATIDAEETPETTGRKNKPRKTDYTAEEKAAAMNSLQTSGKKGMKLSRINLSCSPANLDFVKTMARVRGQSVTKFINEVLDEARESHADLYEKAIEFRNSL